MKPRIDGEFVFAAALGLFVLAIVIATFQLPVLLRYGPLIAGGLTFVCIVVLLVGKFHPRILSWTETALQDLWGGGSASRKLEEPEEMPSPWPSVLRVMAYVLGFLLGVYVFGFFVVPPVFVALYLILDAHVKPLAAIAIAVAICVPAVLALTALNVFLWTGIFPEILPGYLGGAVPPQF
jgi:hypothetical protein